MTEETIQEDQSHYEESLTAGQAFVAFVFLLLSLAASFAFGLMMGRGQGEDRLVVKRDPAIVTEASAVPKKGAGRIVELGVANDDFKQQGADTAPVATIVEPLVEEALPVTSAVSAPALSTASSVEGTVSKPVATANRPVFAQLLSTSDQKTAESLATKLIERGFDSAYVERGATQKGPVFRVRVRFPSNAEARAAETKLKEFATEVWITR